MPPLFNMGARKRGQQLPSHSSHSQSPNVRSVYVVTSYENAQSVKTGAWGDGSKPNPQTMSPRPSGASLSLKSHHSPLYLPSVSYLPIRYLGTSDLIQRTSIPRYSGVGKRSRRRPPRHRAIASTPAATCKLRRQDVTACGDKFVRSLLFAVLLVLQLVSVPLWLLSCR